MPSVPMTDEERLIEAGFSKRDGYDEGFRTRMQETLTRVTEDIARLESIKVPGDHDLDSVHAEYARTMRIKEAMEKLINLGSLALSVDEAARDLVLAHVRFANLFNEALDEDVDLYLYEGLVRSELRKKAVRTRSLRDTFVTKISERTRALLAEI